MVFYFKTYMYIYKVESTSQPKQTLFVLADKLINLSYFAINTTWFFSLRRVCTSTVGNMFHSFKKKKKKKRITIFFIR